MALLLERLRLALHPQFTIHREIASGGMAHVFLGHDDALDRPVAIKVLRPELASAVGVERFVREARILARLRHPGIVPVFQGGDAGGLLYHVLEFQEGETLAQRLERGPLTPDEAMALATGLLGALQAAHDAGVIHRDIKPANIFLRGESALVGDFGIAATTTTAGDALTATGSTPGTAAYMAPEQVRGGAVSPRTDLYAAGLVLFEALTGRRFAGTLGRGLRGRWARCLSRALADNPEVRWPSAEAMALALRPGNVRRAALVGVGVVAVLGMFWVIDPPPPPPSPPTRFVLGIGAFTQAGAPPGTDWADSLRGALADRLTGIPDLVVDPDPQAVATLQLTGRVEERDESLRVEVTAIGADRSSRPLVTPVVPIRAWRTLVDSLMRGVFLTVLREAPYPHGALPTTALGTERWFLAEMARRDGQWYDARRAYEEAVAVDPTCFLCAYRIRDLDRWLSRPTDSANQERLLANLERFPLEYRQVVRATTLPMGPRIDSLRAVTRQHRDFFDGFYLLGDELLHRGPLVGAPRTEALTALRRARHLRPDFAGVWEHLAWALIAEGDGDSSRAALDALAGDHPPQGEFATGLRAFHELAWAWRFGSPALARDVSRALLANPGLADSPDLAAGPRALPALGVHAGAVGFGRLLAQSDRPELMRSGLFAVMVGSAAQGDVATARDAAVDLRNTTDDPEWRLAPLQVAAVFALLGDSILGPGSLRSQLHELGRHRGLGPSQATRVRWTLSLFDTGVVLEPAATPLGRLQRARRAAAAGDPARALALTDGLTSAEYRAHDAAAGAVSRLLRAEWYGALGRHAEAADELLWAEHSDFVALPSDQVQAAELDWALGTEAAWRRAGHLEAEGSRSDELCRLYAEVGRRWQHADAGFAARREAARARLTDLGCGVAS